MHLAWDASPTAGVDDYHLYLARTNDFSTNALTFDVGNTNSATISSTNLTAGRWYIAATASAGTIESDLSGITNFTVPKPVVLRLMGAPTLDFSNEAEFFRLEIGK